MIPEEQRTLTADLLTYLLRNPGAGDTLEGIVHFWTMRIRMDLFLHDIETALTRLVADGLLRERLMPGRHGQSPERYYQVNPGRMQEIECLLRQMNANDRVD